MASINGQIAMATDISSPNASTSVNDTTMPAVLYQSAVVTGGLLFPNCRSIRNMMLAKSVEASPSATPNPKDGSDKCDIWVSCQIRTSTPRKPINTAASRCLPTFSAITKGARMVMKIGIVCDNAAASEISR